MQITSSAFKNNQSIPTRYTCQAKGVNPPLSWNDIPTEAKSLVLIVDDPDAPGGIYVHWLVWNISPDIQKIAANSVPQGVKQGKNSSGRVEYVPPCPPSGTHRYFFKLYTLDAQLNLPAGENKEALLQAMEGHILEESQLIGKYQKS